MSILVALIHRVTNLYHTNSDEKQNMKTTPTSWKRKRMQQDQEQRRLRHVALDVFHMSCWWVASVDVKLLVGCDVCIMSSTESKCCK